ncbi:MAG: hypothetical protein KatS3mg110_3067 [Pirellulaceae bacterium]|nr:MAG: hypothetical protein KatS3mg110_3067 [Pirellulaceae bacterium]
MIGIDWDSLLIAWLHDPPDKAGDLRNHIVRAQQLASAALERDVTPQEVRGHHADQVASAIERLPMPRWNADPQAMVEPHELLVVHPLSASRRGITVPDQPKVEQVVRQLTGGLASARERFLKLWRFLPEELARHHGDWLLMPADTRIPDHSIWLHLDTTAGLHAALHDGQGGAFLVFSLGPVQSFIAAARTLRDLWSGSMILSWLTFRAMLPLVEQLGPTCLVYPAMRGQPLMDIWLRNQLGEDHVPLPHADQRRSPSLPNRFLAMIPWGQDGATARQLAEECRQAARDAWKALADSVHERIRIDFDRIHGEINGGPDAWDVLWQRQIDEYFDIRVAVLPWRETNDQVLAKLLESKDSFAAAFPELQEVRNIEQAIPQPHRVTLPQSGQQTQNATGQWQLRVALALTSLGVQKSVRYYPVGLLPNARAMVPPKCTLLGTLEQMGPAELEKGNQFWERARERLSWRGHRLRRSERLSAVALVRRFAAAALLGEELKLDVPAELRFHDTATVAAGLWLKRARQFGYHRLDPNDYLGKDPPWSGQWLYQPSPRIEDEEEDACPPELFEEIRAARRDRRIGPPPTYYAVLLMDGDKMGKWLTGEMSPEIRTLLHDKVAAYFAQLEQADGGLRSRRPVTPGLHAAISSALAQFALRSVPRIVQQHGGMLIYAGGDDVLAFLPTETALACASEIYRQFRKDWCLPHAQHRHSNETQATVPGNDPCLPEDVLAPLGMGSRATMSAGMAVVHYKESLPFALQAARAAERQAKDQGRDRMVIRLCKRSGEHVSITCPWNMTDDVQKVVEVFRSGASDRWVYRLRAVLDQVDGQVQALPAQAFTDLVTQMVKRAEEETLALLRYGLPGQGEAHQRVTELGQRYLAATGGTWLDVAHMLQSASFLARGKDV